MNFKFWLNENENFHRPNASGFQSMKNILTRFGLKKLNHTGDYHKNTSYNGELFVMGDRAGQFDNSSLEPQASSEYWRIFLKIAPEQLDERSRQAISKFAVNKPDVMDTISNVEKNKIRHNFIPKKEFGNGPEITFQKGFILFSWYVRQPKFVFSILDHLSDSLPRYEGGIDDDDNDGEQYSPFTPQPQGTKVTV
jgi:hypothetical protein